jgi:hypothetical protein
VPDTLTTITNFINSPSGQLAAGATLAGVVWKFFDKVEEKPTDQTKLEIAVWLLGIRVLTRVCYRKRPFQCVDLSVACNVLSTVGGMVMQTHHRAEIFGGLNAGPTFEYRKYRRTL